jgi:hypothetical protein
MNMGSKTRAHAGHTQMIECFVRSGSGIPSKFTRFRVVTRKHGGGAGRILAKKEEGNQRSRTLFRYRDSPEEIQGEC